MHAVADAAVNGRVDDLHGRGTGPKQAAAGTDLGTTCFVAAAPTPA